MCVKNHINLCLEMRNVTNIDQIANDNIKHTLKWKAVVQQNFLSDDRHSYDIHAHFESSPSPLQQEWSALKHIIVNLFINTVWTSLVHWGFISPTWTPPTNPSHPLHHHNNGQMLNHSRLEIPHPLGLQSLGHQVQSMHWVYSEVYMCIKRMFMHC